MQIMYTIFSCIKNSISLIYQITKHSEWESTYVIKRYRRIQMCVNQNSIRFEDLNYTHSIHFMHKSKRHRTYWASTVNADPTEFDPIRTSNSEREGELWFLNWKSKIQNFQIGKSRWSEQQQKKSWITQI